MKLLILHRVPYSFIEYHRVIDHGIHDVVYVGSSAQLATVPPDLPCTRVERPGRAGLAEEVRTLFSPDDAFDRVISVSQYEMMEAAQIRRSLGIEGVSPEQVHIVNDKVAMKAAVAGCGLRVPDLFAAMRRSPLRPPMSLPGWEDGAQTTRWNRQQGCFRFRHLR